MCKFYWKEVSGGINEKAAVDFVNYCKAYIVRKGIIGEDGREDRKELAELVAILKSGKLELSTMPIFLLRPFTI